MIFDKLCGVVEQYFQPLIPTMKRANLFHWQGKPEDLPKSHSEEEAAFLRDEFFLPFRTVAIEDSVSCVVIEDTVDEQRGFVQDRRFIEFLRMNENVVLDSREARTDPSETPKLLDIVHRMKKEFGEVYIIAFGSGRLNDFGPKKYGILGSVSDSIYFMGNRAYPLTTQDKFWGRNQESALKNFATAIEEIMVFNAPNRFVVEVNRANARPPSQAKKILRSHDRPQYTLLTKGEVQRLLDVSSEDAADRRHPAAHWRRRHYRTFRSEHWHESVRGKTITIPACWVGPTEKTVGNKRYRVRIDL